MLRVVLAVAMTTALFAVSMPAVETARVQHSDDRIATELTQVETAAEQLASRNDPPPPNTDGARRELTLRLPAATFGSAGVEQLIISKGESDAGPTTVRWRVGDGTEQVRYLSAVELDAAETLAFHESGRHRLVLVHQHDGSVRIERRDLNRETRPDTL